MNYVPPFGYNQGNSDFDNPFQTLSTGCGNGSCMNTQMAQGCPGVCPPSCPSYDCCNNVVETCNVEQVPHYINYHTHVVNNCVKRHVNVPTYSQSSEVRVINEYVNTPAYVPPVVGTQPAGQPALGAQPMNNGFPNVNNFFVPFPYGN